MNTRQILFVLRARFKAALGVALGTVAVALVGFHLVPRQYTAETSVIVDIRSPDPVAAVLLPAMSLPGQLGTQVDIISSDRTALKVVRILRLDESPTLKNLWLDAAESKGKFDVWIAALLRRSLKITPGRDSNVVALSFKGSDPAFVAAVANAFAQAYIEVSIELKVEPARQYSHWFADQTKALRETLEKAQTRLSEFQRQKGIVFTEEAMDFEVAKLNDLSARLTAVQGETRDAQSKQSLDGVGPLPEVMGSSVVQGLRTDIAQREARLKEAAGNLGVKHPQYLRMESELAELKNRLAAETSHVTSSYSASRAVGKTREAELKAAIEAQKTKLLKLKDERDEISVRLRDVDTARRAYEAVTTRYNQTNLESQSTQTNVSVLNPAVEPFEPSFPKPLPITLLLAVGLGVVLGGAAAVGLELCDRRIRSVDDLAEMMQLPVLCVMGRAKKPGRLAFWRRNTGTVLVAR